MREFSDQKLRSTSRNRGLPPSQPTANKIASRIIGQSPVYEKLIFPNTFTAQAEAISGDRPSTRHGTTSITNQAVRSFGRLISESKLPPRARSDLLLVLDASSSMSPARGSRTGFIDGRRSPVANLRSLNPMLCNVQKDEFRAVPQRAATHAVMCCLSELTNSSVAVLPWQLRMNGSSRRPGRGRLLTRGGHECPLTTATRFPLRPRNP